MEDVSCVNRSEATGREGAEGVDSSPVWNHETFGVHLGRTGLVIGVEKAKRLIFLSDGLRANWQVCLDHFPGALQILDFTFPFRSKPWLCAGSRWG